MFKSEIEKLYKQSIEKAQRYYDNFQSGAHSQYYSHFRTFSNIAWLCEQALSNIDDKNENGFLKERFSFFFDNACRVVYKNDLDDYRDFVKNFIEFCRSEFNFTNRWS